MTVGGWQAANDVERRLVAARSQGDQGAFVVELAWADLVLVVPDPGGAGWGVSTIEGQPHVVVFTSLEAMASVLGGSWGHRPTRFMELARTWPDPSLLLAVNPGLPLEVYLTPATIREVAALAEQPSTPVERRLLEAAQAQDLPGYCAALAGQPLVVPLPGDGAARDLTAADFPWLQLHPQVGEARGHGRDDSVAYQPRWGLPDGVPDGPLVVFTSPQRQRDLLGDGDSTQVPLAALGYAWPHPGADLLVDPGLPHGALVPAEVLVRLGDEVRAAARDEAQAGDAAADDGVT